MSQRCRVDRRAQVVTSSFADLSSVEVEFGLSGCWLMVLRLLGLLAFLGLLTFSGVLGFAGILGCSMLELWSWAFDRHMLLAVGSFNLVCVLRMGVNTHALRR